MMNVNNVSRISLLVLGIILVLLSVGGNSVAAQSAGSSADEDAKCQSKVEGTTKKCVKYTYNAWSECQSFCQSQNLVIRQYSANTCGIYGQDTCCGCENKTAEDKRQDAKCQSKVEGTTKKCVKYTSYAGIECQSYCTNQNLTLKQYSPNKCGALGKDTCCGCENKDAEDKRQDAKCKTAVKGTNKKCVKFTSYAGIECQSYCTNQNLALRQYNAKTCGIYGQDTCCGCQPK